MNKFLFTTSLFLFTSFSFTALSSFGKNAEDTKPVDVYFVGHVPPQFFIENDKVSGFMQALVAEAFKKSKITTNFVIEPWARAQLSALNGDSLIVMIKDEVRIKNFNFSKSFIYSNQQSLFRLAEKSKTKLAKARIGILFGYKYGTSFKPNPKNIIEINSYSQGLELMKSDRLDYILGDRLALACFSKQHGIVLKLDYTIDTTKIFLARSKKFSNDLLHVYDKGFTKISEKFIADSITESLAKCVPENTNKPATH